MKPADGVIGVFGLIGVPFVLAQSREIFRIDEGGNEFGIVTSGLGYVYTKEVVPEAKILKLASSYPLPEETIQTFAASVERLIVVEELQPVLEDAIRMMGIPVTGKALFSEIGEYTAELVSEGLAKAGLIPAPAKIAPPPWEGIVRPPVLCAGCPHMSTYMALRTLEARVTGDIGCYTLGALEPLAAMDTCVAMGSSIGNATGLALAGTEERPVVATIGDSTFLHSGIAPLMDAVYNKANITVIVLDNRTTAMTGGQDHPGTGKTIRGDTTSKVDIETICRALEVPWVEKVDSYDIAGMLQTFREAIAFKGVSVVISDRPCPLDPVKIKGPPFGVEAEGCTACQACMNLGCPSITWSEEWFEGRHKVEINGVSCIGCTLCVQVCPTDCIQLLNT